MKTNIAAVIIGNEILAGRRQDVHFKQTLDSLSARHLRLTKALFLQDDFETLIATYQQLQSENMIVLSFGGIGATPDDRTRSAVASACGVSLQVHPEGLKIMQSKYPNDLNEHRKQLINFPEGAQLIPNPINQVPGFSINHIHCVPGFPEMARPMIQSVLDRYYQHLSQKRAYKALQVFTPESRIAGLMEYLENTAPEVSVSSLPKLNHELELGFDGDTDKVNEALQLAINWLEQEKIHYTILV